MSCGLRQCCLCAVVGTLLQWRMGLCSINIGRIFPWFEPPICPCERWFSVLVMRFICFQCVGFHYWCLRHVCVLAVGVWLAIVLGMGIIFMLVGLLY